MIPLAAGSLSPTPANAAIPATSQQVLPDLRACIRGPAGSTASVAGWHPGTSARLEA
jgi:hypothetical protein